MASKNKRTAKKSHQNNKKNLASVIAIIILIIVIIICAVKLGTWFKDNNKTNEILEDIKEAVIINEEKENELDKYDVDFEKLKKNNLNKWLI